MVNRVWSLRRSLRRRTLGHWHHGHPSHMQLLGLSCVELKRLLGHMRVLASRFGQEHRSGKVEVPKRMRILGPHKAPIEALPRNVLCRRYSLPSFSLVLRYRKDLRQRPNGSRSRIRNQVVTEDSLRIKCREYAIGAQYSVLIGASVCDSRCRELSKPSLYVASTPTTLSCLGNRPLCIRLGNAVLLSNRDCRIERPKRVPLLSAQ